LGVSKALGKPYKESILSRLRPDCSEPDFIPEEPENGEDEGRPPIRPEIVKSKVTFISFGTDTDDLLDKTFSDAIFLKQINIDGNLRTQDYCTITINDEDVKKRYGIWNLYFDDVRVHSLKITPTFGDTRSGCLTIRYEGQHFSGTYVGSDLPVRVIPQIELIDLITEITNVATIASITDIVNIQSIDLIDDITQINRILAINEMGAITRITEPVTIRGLTAGAPSEADYNYVDINNGSTTHVCKYDTTSDITTKELGTEISSAEYDQIEASDDTLYEKTTTYPRLRFKFKISEDIVDITSLLLTFEAKGGTAGGIYFWDNTSQEWDWYGLFLAIAEYSWTAEVLTQISRYVDDEGYVWCMVACGTSIHVDYVELTVTSYDPTLSNTIPVDAVDIETILGAVSASPAENTVNERLKVLETRALALEVLIGEVQASPTENTVNERLKVLETRALALEVLIGEKQESPTQYTLAERLKNIEAYTDGIEAYIDGIEGLLSPKSALLAGEKDVSDSGTPEALASSTTMYYSVCIQAKEGNSGWVKVGNTSFQGHQLEPLDFCVVSGINNLNLIYIKVESNGDGVTYYGV